MGGWKIEDCWKEEGGFRCGGGIVIGRKDVGLKRLNRSVCIDENGDEEGSWNRRVVDKTSDSEWKVSGGCGRGGA